MPFKSLALLSDFTCTRECSNTHFLSTDFLPIKQVFFFQKWFRCFLSLAFSFTFSGLPGETSELFLFEPNVCILTANGELWHEIAIHISAVWSKWYPTAGDFCNQCNNNLLKSALLRSSLWVNVKCYQSLCYIYISFGSYIVAKLRSYVALN